MRDAASMHLSSFGRLSLLASLAALGVACSGGPAVSPHQLEGQGSTKSDPFPACGPKDSYQFVSSEFVCPDGSQPIFGDLRAGQESRRGSSPGGPEGHIIDIYDVPCKSGLVTIFVDMYACDARNGSSDEGDAAEAEDDEEQHPGVL